MAIQFADRAFCFTGGMADLKRTQAEREDRSRRGLTTNTEAEDGVHVSARAYGISQLRRSVS